MANPLPVNTFYDINRLPSDWGIIVFPISISRIENAQSADECMEFIRHFNGHREKDFSDAKIATPQVGLNFLYTDLLYAGFEKRALELRSSIYPQIIKHKNRFKYLIEKSGHEIQIKSAVAFQTWGEVWLNSVDDFRTRLIELRNSYEKDEKFKKYINEDLNLINKNFSEEQLVFFLEEHLAVYLLIHGKIKLNNNYIDHREKWVLVAYPGVPPKGLVYLVQKNPLKLKTNNPYIGQYNLTNKKFYDFSRIDLDSWNYE